MPGRGWASLVGHGVRQRLMAYDVSDTAWRSPRQLRHPESRAESSAGARRRRSVLCGCLHLVLRVDASALRPSSTTWRAERPLARSSSRYPGTSCITPLRCSQIRADRRAERGRHEEQGVRQARRSEEAPCDAAQLRHVASRIARFPHRRVDEDVDDGRLGGPEERVGGQESRGRVEIDVQTQIPWSGCRTNGDGALQLHHMASAGPSGLITTWKAWPASHRLCQSTVSDEILCSGRPGNACVPHGLEAWAQVISGGYESYVAKDDASPYKDGPTRRWLKVKQKDWTDSEDRWQRRISTGA